MAAGRENRAEELGGDTPTAWVSLMPLRKWAQPTPVKNTKNNKSSRVAYSFKEFAEMVGKERTWVYRQVKEGRIRAVTGFGIAMVPAEEIERVFSTVNNKPQ